MKKVRSSKASILINSCTELSKTQFSPLSLLKHTAPRQFSIFINDSDLRGTDLHETSKRTALIEQTLVVLVNFKFTPVFF